MPFTQVPPQRQTGLVLLVPHLPQFQMSVCSLTHTPLQFDRPEPLGHTQLPLAQCVPDGHTVPHAPQLDESVAVSVQTPLHTFGAVPTWQAQLPATQVSLVGHLLPQPPQFIGSDCGLTHLAPASAPPSPPHMSGAFMQEQTPGGSQPRPDGQTVPHWPQLFGSYFVSVQTPPQSELPAAVHVHVPATHAVPLGQASPHFPQFFASLAVSTHCPPHATSDVGQAQAPFTQSVPVGQASPHPPQLS